jgi:hypothetical protein
MHHRASQRVERYQEWRFAATGWQSGYSPKLLRKVREGMAYDIFLSYASADQSEALEVYNAIKTAGGSVFLAGKDLKAGDDFAEKIRKALNESHEVWLLLSPNSLTSEWVISEWGAAWALGKRIVPILFRCAPRELPDRIRRLQCIDFHKCDELVDERFSKKAFVEKVHDIDKGEDRSGVLIGLGPTCPNCSVDSRTIFMSPIPEDFVEIENATHECPRCKLKTRN